MYTTVKAIPTPSYKNVVLILSSDDDKLRNKLRVELSYDWGIPYIP